jgi:hypothetical protein
VAFRRNGVRAGIVYAAAPPRPTSGVRFAVAWGAPPYRVPPVTAVTPANPPSNPAGSTISSRAGAATPLKSTVKPARVRWPASTVAPAGQPAIPWIAALIEPLVKFTPSVIREDVAPL